MDVALELNVDKKPIYIMLCPAGEEHFQGQQMAEYFMLLSTTAPLPPPMHTALLIIRATYCKQPYRTEIMQLLKIIIKKER